jgi:hypothetical protein
VSTTGTAGSITGPLTGVGEAKLPFGAIGIHPSDPLTGLKPGLGFGNLGAAGWTDTELVGLLKVFNRGPGKATGLMGILIILK